MEGSLRYGRYTTSGRDDKQGTLREGDMMLAHTDRGDGKPVVLLHGFPLTGEMWRFQIDSLAQSHRVIVPDLPGFGASAAVEGEVTMATYASAVAELLDAIGVTEPVALAGFSMGGYAAFEILRQGRLEVGALALVDTKATADPPEARAGRHTMAARVREEGSTVIADAMLPKLFSASAGEAVKAEVRATMAAQTPEAVAQALEAMASRPDSTPQLAGISVPALVIAGELDEIATLEESRGMADAVPGAELVEVAGAGHMAPMEAPDAVGGALLDWLDAW